MGDQRFSAFGQLIIHPGRIGRLNRSRDEAIALQARQRQHALRDTLDQLEDLAVTHRGDIVLGWHVSAKGGIGADGTLWPEQCVRPPLGTA